MERTQRNRELWDTYETCTYGGLAELWPFGNKVALSIQERSLSIYRSIDLYIYLSLSIYVYMYISFREWKEARETKGGRWGEWGPTLQSTLTRCHETSTGRGSRPNTRGWTTICWTIIGILPPLFLWPVLSLSKVTEDKQQHSNWEC